MTIIHVKPMPEVYKKFSMKFRPGIPPIFKDFETTGITDDDRQLARDLFQLLDDDSKQWYGNRGPGQLFEDPLKNEKSKKSKGAIDHET